MKPNVALLYYILLFFTSHVECHQLPADQLEEIEKSCIKKLSIDEFTVDYNLKQLYMPEGNHEFNNFMGCVWKKKGFIDSKNNLQYDLFRDYIAEKFFDAVGNTKSANAFAKDIVNGCIVVKGDTPGQTGIMLMNCVTRLFQN